MAKKVEEQKVPEAARPVIAVEYDGELYPTFQKAEAARAKADLFPLLCPPSQCSMDYSGMMHAISSGRREALDAVLENAERVHGILSRYLDAAKVSLPTEVR